MTDATKPVICTARCGQTEAVKVPTVLSGAQDGQSSRTEVPILTNWIIATNQLDP